MEHPRLVGREDRDASIRTVSAACRGVLGFSTVDTHLLTRLSIVIAIIELVQTRKIPSLLHSLQLTREELQSTRTKVELCRPRPASRTKVRFAAIFTTSSSQLNSISLPTIIRLRSHFKIRINTGADSACTDLLPRGQLGPASCHGTIGSIRTLMVAQSFFSAPWISP